MTVECLSCEEAVLLTLLVDSLIGNGEDGQTQATLHVEGLPVGEEGVIPHCRPQLQRLAVCPSQ